MSVYIEFYEKLAVINETEQTNEVVEKFLDYLKQLNHHPGIRELSVDRLNISADGAVLELRNNTAQFGSDTLLWQDSSSFAQVLEAVAQAKDVSFEMAWSADKTMAIRYGIEYFSDYFEVINEKEELAQYVTYRSLENWDCEERLYAYLFGKTKDGVHEGLVVPDSKEFVTQPQENVWHLSTGKMEISADGIIANEVELDEFREKADELAETFDYTLELEEDDDSFKFIVSANSFEIEAVQEMTQQLQYFCDFAHENDADFTLEIYFENDEDFDFRYLCLLTEDGKVILRHMEY